MARKIKAKHYCFQISKKIYEKYGYHTMTALLGGHVFPTRVYFSSQVFFSQRKAHLRILEAISVASLHS